MRIVWGSGRETVINNVAADQFLAVREEGIGADFDFDGDVDGFDFLAWQRGHGTPAPNAVKSDGDADADRDVDGDDLTEWENAYAAGQTPLSAALSLPSTDSLPSNLLLSLDSPSVGSTAVSSEIDEYFSSSAYSARPADQYSHLPATSGPYLLSVLVSALRSPEAAVNSSGGNAETDLALEIMDEDELSGLSRRTL